MALSDEYEGKKARTEDTVGTGWLNTVARPLRPIGAVLNATLRSLHLVGRSNPLRLSGFRRIGAFTSDHHNDTLMLMRTTLEIEQSVLEAARSAAAARGVTIGKIISEWAKAGINAERKPGPVLRTSVRNGIVVFARDGDAKPITSELVKRIMEEDNI
jgi:hypothetical protein